MKVAIMTLANFPEGLAISNRVFYYAKGLQDNDVEVKIFIVKPTEMRNNIKNTEIRGVFKGIEFEYTLAKTIRSSSFIQRRIDDILGPMKAAMLVIKNNYDTALLIGDNSFYHPMLFKTLFFFFSIKFFVERTELMFHGKKQGGIYKIKNKMYERIIYKNLDGFFTISHSLKEIYSKLVSKNCDVELIPVIVNEKDIYNPNIERTRNLVYTGPLVQKKDGVVTIIRSFLNLASKFPGTDLILTGDIDSTLDKKKILNVVKDSKFKSRIKLVGFIPRIEMIKLLNSAAGLVLAKPTSNQADTCFPTKLGEYLSSGNPIVVTRTGEIPLYLKDGENAYIAEPDSVEDFTEKLKQLLDNPIQAKEIGKKGREVAKEKFNYYELSKKVIELIKNAK